MMLDLVRQQPDPLGVAAADEIAESAAHSTCRKSAGPRPCAAQQNFRAGANGAGGQLHFADVALREQQLADRAASDRRMKDEG